MLYYMYIKIVKKKKSLYDFSLWQLTNDLIYNRKANLISQTVKVNLCVQAVHGGGAIPVRDLKGDRGDTRIWPGSISCRSLKDALSKAKESARDWVLVWLW